MARISSARAVDGDLEKQMSAFWDLIGALGHDGHILGKENRPLLLPGECVLYAFVPAPDALAESTWNSWITQCVGHFATAGLAPPQLKILGLAHEEPEACDCTDSGSLILYTTFLEVHSPVKCGDCFRPIPLYRIPRIRHEEHYGVIQWASAYKSCDSLWINSSTGERFAARELSRIDSSLSKRGLEICAEIESATGKRVYFYLWHYYGRSEKQERARKCPKCGGEWVLEEPVHRLLHFRCDGCRIVSSIASDFW